MILIVAFVASTLIALLRGGHLSRLAELPLRHAWLVLAAVALQYPLVYNLVGAGTVLGVPLAGLMMIGSYVLLLVVVYTNRRLPGMPIVALGVLSNLLVIALNGGWMPITPEAVARLGHTSRVADAGQVAKVWGAKDVVLTRAETRLWWLSDVFVLTAPFPVPAAFSIGDLLVAAGIFWLLQQALTGGKEQPLPGRGATNGALEIMRKEKQS